MSHHHGHFEHLMHAVEVVDLATVISISWFSFILSWHCAAMCGPLVCARFSRRDLSSSQVALSSLLYNAGRLLSYIGLGALFGWTADFVGQIIPGLGVGLSLFFAVVLMVQGVLLFLNREFAFVPKNLMAWMSRTVRFVGLRSSVALQSFVLGLLTALLPCMTLSSALAAAAMTGDAQSGALVMFGFVLGTWPVMYIVPIFSTNISQAIASKVSLTTLRRMGGVLLFIASAITIVRIYH